jgi:alpha-N-arabinofuranosidase
MDAVCRFVAAKKKLSKRTMLCFDEWNVWYKNMEMNGRGQEAPHLIEEVFNLEDALVVSQYFNSFFRHADVLKIANIAQIVNIIAPILTRPKEILVQSIFHAFAMYSTRGTGHSLKCTLDGPAYENKEFGKVGYLDCSALLDGDKLKVFAVNRDTKNPRPLEISMADKKIATFLEGELLTGPDAKAANSWEDQKVIAPRGLTGVEIKDGKAFLSLPPLSSVACTLQVNG